MKSYNFVLIGVGGYIAPRHLKAIKETKNNLVAALDISDSVGIMDNYFLNAKFFTEFERFDRFVEKLRLEDSENKIEFVSICSPNYLHDAHIRFALRVDANAICEKPIVINPWNLDRIEQLEEESGKRVYTVLQLRLHQTIKELKKRIDNEVNTKKHNIKLTYITPRGNWYLQSWKGDLSKSGGIAINIGIHFFDMLLWIFGKMINYEVHYSGPKKMSGYLSLEKANVSWFLSTDIKDLPKGDESFRLIEVDGEEIDFSKGFTDLHTEVYKEILAGRGFGIKEARPSIELIYKLRNADISKNSENFHPLLTKILKKE